MLKVAILDDYQNVSQEFVDLKKLSGKYEFKIFSEPFLDEADAIEQLSDFEALLICLLYTSPSPRDATLSRMPSSA